MLLWVAQDREQHSWEQSMCCYGVWMRSYILRKVRALPICIYIPRFSSPIPSGYALLKWHFLTAKLQKQIPSLSAGRIFILRTRMLQTICQRFVISAQMHGLDIWGLFSPLLCPSQLGEANATNQLTKRAILFSPPTFTYSKNGVQ